MDDNIYRLHPTFFGAYGLNEFRNFNHRTISVTLENDMELNEFMVDSLLEHGCLKSAFFGVNYEGEGIICWFNPPITMTMPEKKIKKMLKKGKITKEQIEEQEENAFNFFRIKEFELNDFSRFDGDIRLCCYALMVENEPGEWTVIGDRFNHDDDDEDYLDGEDW